MPQALSKYSQRLIYLVLGNPRLTYFCVLLALYFLPCTASEHCSAAFSDSSHCLQYNGCHIKPVVYYCHTAILWGVEENVPIWSWRLFWPAGFVTSCLLEVSSWPGELWSKPGHGWWGAEICVLLPGFSSLFERGGVASALSTGCVVKHLSEWVLGLHQPSSSSHACKVPVPWSWWALLLCVDSWWKLSRVKLKSGSNRA